MMTQVMILATVICTMPEAPAVRFDFAPDSSLVVIPVLVNDRGPFKFLLDTGANNTLLSTNLAKKLGVLPDGKVGELVTPAGSLLVYVRRLGALEVGGVRIQKADVAVASFSMLKTLAVDGILGGDLLKHFTVSIDYSKQLVRMELRRCDSAVGVECRTRC